MALRTRVVRLASETRYKYVPVSSGPASLRGTVSKTNITARVLDRGTQRRGTTVGLALFYRGFLFFWVPAILVLDGPAFEFKLQQMCQQGSFRKGV